jgi:hypothetical protein
VDQVRYRQAQKQFIRRNLGNLLGTSKSKDEKTTKRQSETNERSQTFRVIEVDPKYLEDESDFETLVEGTRLEELNLTLLHSFHNRTLHIFYRAEVSVKLVENTTSFQRIQGRKFPRAIPNVEFVEFKSYAYFSCLAR